MTSYDDDQQIDFRKLEREVHNAEEADAKYWRENDAKFRAVNQKVASYDEFKDIVKASHLKPLEKDDRLTNIQFIQPWNSQARKTEPDSGKSPDISANKEGKSAPNNSQEFVREWRKLKKVTESQFKFLLDLGADRLGEIFKPEIVFGLLGEFAHCLNDRFSEELVDASMAILEALSKTNRFSLTVQFLSSKEKEDLKGLFGKMRVCLENKMKSDPDFDKETLDKMEELEKVYEIKK